jgi:hypothetical protein
VFAGCGFSYPQRVERQEDRRGRRAPDAPLVSRPLISPRFAADPRLRAWLARAVIAAALYVAFMISLGWQYAVSAATIYVTADVIYRSKTMSVIPAAVRVTSAQRSTRRRLRMLRPAGYLALNACRIPGTESIIDHVVVGPAGVFTLDSERMDRRLPIRAIGGMLYHGPASKVDRIDHALAEAQTAADKISAALGRRVRVHPAMIIYGPALPWKIMRLKGVDVFDGGRIGTFFRNQSKQTAGRHLSSEQIAQIFAAASRALPPIGD